MNFITIVWDESPGGNVEHVEKHGLTTEEVDEVLQDPHSSFDYSRTTGYPAAFGGTSTGRYIIVIFDEIEASAVYPITAYDVERPF